ncbi:MAG TPA: hypothetical protein VH482_01220 [Thermomicrobiales bacterium]|jgi:hypothetical protein
MIGRSGFRRNTGRRRGTGRDRVHAVFMSVGRFIHARPLSSERPGAQTATTGAGVAERAYSRDGGSIVNDSLATIHADAADFDVVNAASAQSFPASDPPAWATGRGHPATQQDGVIGPRRRGERRMHGVHSEEQGDRAAIL